MSVYQILKSIAGEFNAKITEQNIHTNEYLKRVQEAVRDRTVCIILDEIMFNPYDATQLRDILEHRASMAFCEGALSREVVPLVSAFAASKNGDARYGLELLSLCGNICDEEDRDYITEDDVRHAQRLADMMLVYRAVNKLTSSQKLLLLQSPN